MPPLRTLFAGLCLATILPPGAEARSHHFSMPQRHIHANSPYGQIRGYVAAEDEHDPHYTAAEQKCETKAAMGVISKGATGNATAKAGGNHVHFYAECMVSEGAWRTRYGSNTGDKFDD
ncbi:hypothetical protein [Komagataeibacter europaeus]|uniref:hypothetical protein n=1 Tax=Komagataeibacter europaeus TaxID=33995 RepID=UPI000237F29F|nr:hypothetical protein [Komagataeibacter europaeus]